MIPRLCARCRRSLEDEPEPVGIEVQAIMLSVAGRFQPFRASDILSAEAQSKGVLYTLNDGTTAFEYHTLQSLVDGRPAIVRVSRYAAVRVGAIRAVIYKHGAHDVELIDGRRFPVARRHWRDVQAVLNLEAVSPGNRHDTKRLGEFYRVVAMPD